MSDIIENTSKRTSIVEDDGLQKDWYAQARNVTAGTLAEFVRHLAEDYGHDYGTIIHACAAAALAGVRAVNSSDQGGITGFQAGGVMWEFIQHWMHKDGPMRLLEYEDMLFPQNAENFTTISAKTWAHLQAEAQKRHLGDDMPSGPVREHWQSIIAGKVPFGFTVEPEEETDETPDATTASAPEPPAEGTS